jgi:hypothetical protein
MRADGALMDGEVVDEWAAAPTRARLRQQLDRLSAAR